MEHTLPEDILYLLLDQVYYDEQVALPDYSTLTSLCLVNRAVLIPAQRLLFRWVRLLSLRGVKLFANACRRKPWLGRGVYIAHVRLTCGPYPYEGPGVNAAELALVLAAAPRTRTLILDIDLPDLLLPGALQVSRGAHLAAWNFSRIAALPAARTISSLHLSARTNAALHPLLDVLPAVIVLILDFHNLDMRFPPLPQAANRSFLEVAISFDTGTPPYACAAFFEPQWRIPLQVFSIRYGARFSMLPRQPTPAATLRSLKVDYWDASVAAFSASCSQLVELILWEPASLGDLTLPFADTLPPTLEHFAFPDDLIEVNSSSRAQRGAEFTALSQLPSRLERLRCVSMYNGSQSSWAVMLGVNCASVGIAVRRYDSVEQFIASSFGLKRTIIPRRFDVRDFAQLQAKDGGLNSDPIDELVIPDDTLLTRIRRKWRNFSL